MKKLFDNINGEYYVCDSDARSDIENLTTKVNKNSTDINTISKYIYNLNDSYRYLVVSKVVGSKFNTIKSAIDYAINNLKVSNSNKVTILITSGVYNEKIVLNDVHGLSFYGIDKNSCIISFAGTYPDCVVHVQGDYYFRNLKFINTNKTTYIVHQDPSDTSVSGTTTFEDCIFDGGSNGIGYGSGNNTALKIINCFFLRQGDYCIYAHNSPYARTNQFLFLIGNLFVSTKCLLLDDTGYTYGQTKTSKLDLYFKNNVCQYYSYGSVLFRKNTNDTSQNKPYIESDNMRLGLSCSGNDNIPAMNSNINNGISGILKYNLYIYIPPAGTDNYSHVSVTVPVYANAYNIKVNSLTLPGVGQFNSEVGIENKGINSVNFLFNNNASIIGKVCILNFTMTLGG